MSGPILRPAASSRPARAQPATPSRCPSSCTKSCGTHASSTTRPCGLRMDNPSCIPWVILPVMANTETISLAGRETHSNGRLMPDAVATDARSLRLSRSSQRWPVSRSRRLTSKQKDVSSFFCRWCDTIHDANTIVKGLTRFQAAYLSRTKTVGGT